MIKTCAMCGKVFHTDKRAAKYCCEEHARESARFQRKAWFMRNCDEEYKKRKERKKQRMEGKEITKKCKICDTEFIPEQSGRKLYCSDECARIAKNRSKMKYATKPKGEKKDKPQKVAVEPQREGETFAEYQVRKTLNMVGKIDVESFMKEIGR